MPAKAKFTAFPAQYEHFQSPEDCHRAYDKGWMGCIPNEAAKEKFRDLVRETSGYKSFADAAHDHGFAGSGKGKLVLAFRAVEALFPGAYPGEAQQTGCCVSMGTRNALLLTFACQYFAQRAQGLPQIPEAGIHTGAFSNAPIYWFRGSNGDGWDCATAAMVACKYVGLVPCKDWGDGVDLTHCNAHNDHMYGGQRPPHELIDKFGDHRAQSAAEINSFEELSDALANGFGVNTCGGEGFSGHRDENGVMNRAGAWSHSMGFGATDDRAIVHKLYNDSLVAVEQSWGMWGSGPRKIVGTDMELPNGWFWARWKDVQHRWMGAFSGTKTWKPNPLGDWGTKAAYN
jgi:hypothetical protein